MSLLGFQNAPDGKWFPERVKTLRRLDGDDFEFWINFLFQHAFDRH